MAGVDEVGCEGMDVLPEEEEEGVALPVGEADMLISEDRKHACSD